MLNEKKSKRGTVIALLCALALWALVILLENTMKPTGMLFTVLKKGAVYALVAVSMNLLNGFTGLFSLGQAGFMLLGAYTYAIIMVPDKILANRRSDRDTGVANSLITLIGKNKKIGSNKPLSFPHFCHLIP